MKKKYIKTDWEDGKTIISAEKMNKIENALVDIHNSALSPSELVEGKGIELGSNASGEITVSVSNKVQVSDTIPGIEKVVEEGEIKDDKKLYFLLDPDTNKMKAIYLGNIKIYEVE